MNNSGNFSNDKSSANNMLSKKVQDNMKNIESIIKDCPDIITKKLVVSENREAYFLYVKGLVDIDLIQRDFISPILSMGYDDLSNIHNIERLPVSNMNFCYDVESVSKSIFSGRIVFLLDGVDFAVTCELVNYIKRNVEEPETEKNVKGAHEGFIEPISSNIGILRRKVQNQSLKFKMFTIGETTQQGVAVAYIDGIANMSLVDKLYGKINSINYDGFMAIGILEQIIADFPYSPFPQFITTERPDRAVAALLEGRLLVLLDGTPVVIIVPVEFFSFFRAPDDYSFNWYFGSFMGLIRLLALFTSLFLPGLYIALLTFHYYMIPINLLIPLAESRAAVPFPPIIEALLMEIVIETLREASVRLPTYVGASIGVVGGIVIGQAAVQAGIVSNLMVIVVSVTAIASFSIPIHNMAANIRVIRFAVMLLSSVFGIIGVVISAVMMLANLVVIESLDQPYFQPVFPFKFKDFKDVVLRLPYKTQKLRPDIAQPVDEKRGKNNG